MYSLPDELKANFRADLHCHSTLSDGSMTPKELIDLAKQIGIQALSITDHDTIAAYEEAAGYAKSVNFILAAGVEFSCEYKKRSVHVLGYDFCLENSAFLQYCEQHRHYRKQRNREILQRLRRLSIIIEEEDLEKSFPGGSVIGRPHIAHLMMKKGYVSTIQQAFQRYIGDESCCFVRGYTFSVKEAIDVIGMAGGKAFLAHPHLYADVPFAKEILSLGFQGVECYYGRGVYSSEKTWLQLASQMGLLISGGSDFHGAAKPHISLGSSYVDYAAFSAIFTRQFVR